MFSRISIHFRRKRCALFLSLIDSLPKPITILDLGGTEQFWIQMGFSNQKKVHITILNKEKISPKTSYFCCIQGDALHLDEFKSKQFDIVFSHSLLEHLATYGNQKKVAKEIMRIGKYFFVQTPNKHFFLEPHYLFPFFYLIPKRLQPLYVHYMSIKWWRKRGDINEVKKHIKKIRLIVEKEITSLFPNGTVYEEKVCGFTKSYTISDMF